MLEYMRAYDAKSTMFVRAGGCEHMADAAIAEKDGFLEVPFRKYLSWRI